MAQAPLTRTPARTRRSLFGRGIRLGRLFGFEINLDTSVLLIALLVVFNLGGGLLPAWHPHWNAALRWSVALAAALLFFASILAHELSHALVGRRVGIPVSGITLFLFGGMAHMEEEPERPRSEFLMAIIGPITSLLIGAGSTFVGALLAQNTLAGVQTEVALIRHAGPLATLLLWLGPLNIALGLFNLVPGFPLDGGRVLRAALWWKTGNYKRATAWASFAGQAFAWLLIASGVMMLFGWHVPLLGRGFVQGLWLLLIGWFLSNAAKASYYQALVIDALQGVAVWRLMRPQVTVVSADELLFDFVHQKLLPGDQQCYPVVSPDGRLLGVVSLREVRNVDESTWRSTTAAAAMIPVERAGALRPSDPAAQALQRFGRLDLEELPVADGGTLVGVLHRNDLVRWLSLKLDDEARSPWQGLAGSRS